MLYLRLPGLVREASGGLMLGERGSPSFWKGDRAGGSLGSNWCLLCPLQVHHVVHGAGSHLGLSFRGRGLMQSWCQSNDG